MDKIFICQSVDKLQNPKQIITPFILKTQTLTISDLPFLQRGIWLLWDKNPAGITMESYLHGVIIKI